MKYHEKKMLTCYVNVKVTSYTYTLKYFLCSSWNIKINTNHSCTILTAGDFNFPKLPVLKAMLVMTS